MRLIWDGVSFLEMTVPAKLRNRMCGLCGNFNGDKADDFLGRFGAVHKEGRRFGESWRVGGLGACSVLPGDMPPESEEPQCVQSWESRIKSHQHCNALHSSLFEKCRPAVEPDYFSKACRLDTCQCPNDQCHCEVLAAYARECERHGVLVHDWREHTFCKNVTAYKYPPRSKVNDGSHHHHHHHRDLLRREGQEGLADISSSSSNDMQSLSTLMNYPR